MSGRSQPIAQRIHTVTVQTLRLRQQLASKSRADFKSDAQYSLWRAQTDALLSELENELSVLAHPGDYDQLPPAVVAEELGTTTNKVRLLIKGSEILATGKPAHEYISREELATACEVGMKELLRRLDQGAAEIFEEAVAYLHQGQLPLADRACRRIVARESIVGPFALPYETALLLARAEITEVEARLGFIRRAESAERARYVRHLRRLLRGMSLQDETARAIAERVLHAEEERQIPQRRLFGAKLCELQQAAMLITTVACDELDRRWRKRLPPSQQEELGRIIRDAVYSTLHALASYDRLASSKEFVDSVSGLVPRYYESARLLHGLVKGNESGDENI